MNPIAEKLNKDIQSANPAIFDMLSSYGKRIFFPSAGILAQSAEAKEKAFLYNATIGIATEKSKAIGLSTITKQVELENNDYLPYAPSFGRPDLRQKWQELQLVKNPTLQGEKTSLPVVTNALTHGISLVSSLFLEVGDKVILSDHFWGNYNLYFNVTLQTKMIKFSLFDQQGGFNQISFKETLIEASKKVGKIFVILNFPNNPTGYSIRKNEVEGIVTSLKEIANTGTKIVVLCDDAYFGLFFEEDVLQESIFSYLATAHKNILAVKVDGATKEDYVWGLRCGFVTYANPLADQAMYKALEEKTAGAIRATISNVSNLGQKLVLNSLNDADYAKQKQQKFDLLQARYNKVKEILSQKKFGKYFEPYPYNSGYFMCVKLLFDTNAEEFRLYLLKKKGIGTIAIGDKNIRIAFSCTQVEHLIDLFEKMYEAAEQLTK